MPFDPVTRLFTRVWAFVDRFQPGETADRADFDEALADVAAGINGLSTEVGGRLTTVEAATGWYLGVSETAPTEDLSGGALVEGMWYVSDPDLIVFVYKDAEWQSVYRLDDISDVGLLLLGAETVNDALVALGISATAAEINSLDGLTATTEELNAVDGVTATGTALIRATDQAAARVAIGASEVGSGVLTAADAAAARTTLDAMRRASVDVTDLDDATENAPFRFVAGASNAPFAATGMGITVAAATVANLMQIAVRASNGDMWVRSRSGSSWTAWGKVTRDADVPGLFNASGSAPVYACRAWVLFNGTGTPAVIAAGNVSSITDNGTGDYTVNFTTAMPDANYAMSGSGRRDDTFNEPLAVGEARTALATRTTSALRVIVCDMAGGLRDGDRVSVIIHR